LATSIRYFSRRSRYREIQSRKVFEVLERPGSMEKNLQRLFEETVARALSAEGRRGCFVGDSMSELAGRCKETANRTCNSVAAAEKIFQRALERGKRQGDFPGLRNPRAAAASSYLICGYSSGMIDRGI
jgi:TetR/AcrR family transcriptional repressor of nem operon